jgi:nicotinamidase-related amidase
MSWLIKSERSCLLLLNAQHRLLSRVDSPRELVGNCATLLRAAQALGLPVLAFESDTVEHGPTVDELAELLPKGAATGGSLYSAYEHPAVRAWLLAGRRDQVLLCGIETHVAVLHTAFGLIADEYRPVVPIDATGTRGGAQHAVALARLRDRGAAIVTTEMVLHEWAGPPGSPSFRRVRELLP